MKYSELPDSLKSWIKGTVTEHEDGSISVDGDVPWFDGNFTKIPIKFRRVTGDFYYGGNNLTSLENAPDFIGGNFWCFVNKLTSLDGLGEVKGEIFCSNNLVPEEQLIADYHRKRAKKELAEESLAIDTLICGV